MSNVTQRKSLSGKAWAILAAGAALFIAIALTITHRRHGLEVGGPDFQIDPNFGIPTPPRGMPVSTATHSLIPGMSLGTLLICLAAWDGLKTRSLLPIAMVFGGAMITLPEVFFDVIGAVYFPVSQDAVAYKILGREMPVVIILGWTFIGGAFGYLIYRIIASNPTTKWVWLTWLIYGMSCGMLEENGLRSGLYHYYGNQPLILISRWPWWWMPCNSVGVFLAAAIAYRYRASLRTWKAPAMILITPMSVTAVYGAIALPSWIVVNANYGWLLTQCGGLLTIALGLVVMYFIIDRVLGRDPFDFDQREPPESTGELPSGQVTSCG